jgi:hypothetical protein
VADGEGGDGAAPNGVDTSSPAPEAAPPSSAPAAPETTPSSDASTAPSSSAPAESKETLLDAVLKAVPPKGEDPDKLTLPGEASPASGTGPDGPSEPHPDELPPDPTPEEMARYSSKTRDRVKLLLRQRNEAQQAAQSLQAEAELTRGVRQYLQEIDLGKEDFSLLLDLGAALRKGDFKTFYQGVKPYVDLAEEALGIQLPPDVAQYVQQGHMTTEAAKRYAQERLQRQIAESRDQRTRATHEQQQTARQQEDLGNAVRDTVAHWENEVRKVDPDYGHKQDLMKVMLWSVVREMGTPQNPQHAVQIANEAYRRVNTQVARFRPAPRPTQASPSSVHRATGVSPEPKSLMEAAMIGLERSRRSA